MAEALAFSVAENLIPKLASIALNEIGLMYGLRDNLKKLVGTLSVIKDVLLDAEEMQERSHFIRNRIKMLEEVLYDADDVLDEIATEDLRRKLDTRERMTGKVSDFFSSSNQLKFRYKTGHAIREITDRLDQIASDISKFNFISNRVIVDKRFKSRERETVSFVEKSVVIGREKEKANIIEMLMGSGNNGNVSFIAIVGIGGLGKTTLAQLVYSEEMVVKYFEARIWVCVSEDFDRELIIRNILKSIGAKEVGDLNSMDQLQTCLRKNLDGKRYLLVLDDVWNESRDKWNELVQLLMCGANGSKIVVTTRSSEVASSMGIDSSFILEGLTPEQSWQLFGSLAFREGLDKVDSKVITIGKKIIERCKGVPLAIKTLGSTMRSKTTESEWLSIQNDGIWSLSLHDSGILPVLKVSYDRLPTHLKHCFSYCAIFPKDYIIKYEVLIQLWMAQDYVQPSSRCRDLEKIGDSYFRDLLFRSFFQEVELDSDGKIVSCKMHDLIHDLATEIAGSNCGSITERSTDDTSYERIRHVSVQRKSEELPRRLLEEKGIRTLFVLVDFWKDILQQQVMSNLGRLRVLDLHMCDIHHLHVSIGVLKHLRYLDLSWNVHMEYLPNSISSLLNLQTLKLSNCQSLRRLPHDISKLISLRYLMLDECHYLQCMPSGLGKLTSLQRLSRFVVGEDEQDCARLIELSGLNDIGGEINIVNLGKVRRYDVSKSKQAILKEKKNLRSLILDWEETGPRWFGGNKEDPETLLEFLEPHPNLKQLSIKNYLGARLPSWVMKLSLVIELTIKNCNGCLHLPPLDQLPFLKTLTLDGLCAVEYIQEDDNDSNNQAKHGPPFPCLTKLTISNCLGLTSVPLHPKLEELTLISVSEKLLQHQLATATGSKLKSLHISGSTDLETLSEEDLHNLTSLRSLEICYCSGLLRLTSTGDGFGGLTSLRSLTIKGCEKLTSLSRDFQHLTALEVLYIMNCEELDLADDDGVSWKGLKSLRTLYIEEIPKMATLPVGIQYLTTLRILYIYGFAGSEAAPDWIANLTSLQRLKFENCPNLTSLPQGMCHLTSLRGLMIKRCPNLKGRCQKDKGDDWDKISHIANIAEDEEIIQGSVTYWIYSEY